MHSQPTPPIRPRASRRARAWVWLLALGIALQGTVIATTRAAEPAHVHAATATATEVDRDPMLDGVRVVQNHHASARHHHSEVKHHAHDLADADVHYNDNGSASTDAVKNGSAKRFAADLDTPTASFSVPPAALPPGAGCVALRCDYTSHVGARLERPPR